MNNFPQKCFEYARKYVWTLYTWFQLLKYVRENLKREKQQNLIIKSLHWIAPFTIIIIFKC